MSIGRDVIGKTGTIDSNAAVWFAGATPDLAAAVWVGDPRGGYRYPLKDLTINGRYYPKVFGSSLPGPTWKAAMEGALADSPPVAMELINEWGLRPARQGGAPSQRSQYAAPEVPWWQRTFPGFDGPSRGRGQGQAPQEPAPQELAE
jgi:membrane peptidoglycan carboxypeptidase